MTRSSLAMTEGEQTALRQFLILLLDAGDAGRQRDALGMRARERWDIFDPISISATLPRTVTILLSRCGAHAFSNSGATDTDAEAIAAMIPRDLTDMQLRLLLVAAAYWVDPPQYVAFGDDSALGALEELSALINGFLQSLPARRLPEEHPDAQNRRFRAYQRRRYGQSASPRTPQLLIKRLPPPARELIEIYEDRLVFSSGNGAHLLAALLAVALGRPVDETIVAQLEVMLAAAVIWNDVVDLASGGPDTHPILGSRSKGDQSARWDQAAAVISENLGAIQSVSPEASDPTFVQTPARTSIANTTLDPTSLDALEQLGHYVTTFALWVNANGRRLPVNERITSFDVLYTGQQRRLSSGADVVSMLPPNAVKIVATFAATSEGDPNGSQIGSQAGSQIALELATALGDQELQQPLLRMLHTAAAWLGGNVSALERAEAGAQQQSESDENPQQLPELEPFNTATRKEAESLLNFGASVVELVRFSRNLGGSSDTPPGWWIKFHRRELSVKVATPRELLERLPDGARRLLDRHIRILDDHNFKHLNAPARALGQRLRRGGDERLVRTLAVGLAVASVWRDMEAMSRGRRSDTLLGVETATPRDRYRTGRAQALLDWGLQDSTGTESKAGG